MCERVQKVTGFTTSRLVAVNQWQANDKLTQRNTTGIELGSFAWKAWCLLTRILMSYYLYINKSRLNRHKNSYIHIYMQTLGKCTASTNINISTSA